jgi:hypothetical protein
MKYVGIVTKKGAEKAPNLHMPHPLVEGEKVILEAHESVINPVFFARVQRKDKPPMVVMWDRFKVLKRPKVKSIVFLKDTEEHGWPDDKFMHFVQTGKPYKVVGQKFHPEYVTILVETPADVSWLRTVKRAFQININRLK